MTTEQLDTREKLGEDPSSVYKYWSLELESAGKAEEDYRKAAGDLIKRYSGEIKLDFNILWANVEVLKPTIYSNSAKPDVRRRYNTQDPVGKQISLLMERSISYTCEHYNFDAQIEMVRDEMLITGRSVAWVEYAPVITGLPDGTKAITDQKLSTKYVSYDDFRMSPASCWGDVRWVARRHMPTRDELKQQFGDKLGSRVPLNASMIDSNSLKEAKDVEHLFKRAEVWEIWDRQKRQRIWIATGLKQPLLTEDDPYGLEGFFPCPMPLYAFRTPNSMKPTAEYEIYRKQVEILGDTSRRISLLTKELKVKGLYNAVQEAAVKGLRNAGDGEFIPVTTPDINATVSNMIAYWPIEKIAQVLTQLYQARDAQLATIYQITGLSDIVRGSTSASETATAQQLKGNFATMRMEPRQRPMQNMIRDIFRIKAEIIAEHFTPEMLQQMTQIQVTEEMLTVLRDDKLRGYRIDIETDSTVRADEDADKQRRIEFLGAFTDTVQKLAPLVQAGMLDMESAKAMLGFVSRGFKIGRELEEAIEAMGQGMQQQQQQPEKPHPETQKLELQREIGHKKIESERELGLAKIAADKESKIATAEIGSRPATTVQFDTQGALDGVAQTIAAMAQMMSSSMQQQSEFTQQIVRLIAEGQNQTAQVQAQQGQQFAESANSVAQAVAILAENERKPVVKTINAPRGADGRIDFSRVVVTERT